MAEPNNTTFIAFYQVARAEMTERIRLRDNTLVIYFAVVGALSGVALRDKGHESALLLIPCLAFGATLLVGLHHSVIIAIEAYCARELGPNLSSTVPHWEVSAARKTIGMWTATIRGCVHGFLISAPAVAALIANWRFIFYSCVITPEAILWWVGAGFVSVSIIFEFVVYARVRRNLKQIPWMPGALLARPHNDKSTHT
jgi:hypothetical protein